MENIAKKLSKYEDTKEEGLLQKVFCDRKEA